MLFLVVAEIGSKVRTIQNQCHSRSVISEKEWNAAVAVSVLYPPVLLLPSFKIDSSEWRLATTCLCPCPFPYAFLILSRVEFYIRRFEHSYPLDLTPIVAVLSWEAARFSFFFFSLLILIH